MQISLSLSLTAQLRSSISAYAVSGLDPALAFDFINNYFRTGGSDSTITDALVHNSATAGNATMVDSDGLLKWRPHNLMSYSEDFTQWSNTAVTTGGQFNSLTGLSNATLIETTGNVNRIQRAASAANPANTQYTYSVMAKAGTVDWLLVFDTGYSNSGAWFDLGSGALGTVQINALSAEIKDLGDGWYQCSVTTQATTTRSTDFVIEVVNQNNDSGAVNGENLYIWGAHLYRSDLGGMVNNPDQPAGLETYVPTTSTERHLPRVGHHIYNGSAWVNEGVLYESEARTNLLTYSEDLSNGAWTKVTGATIGTPVTRKGISLGLIESNGVSNFGNVTQSMGSVANGAYATFSCFIEAGTSTETAIRIAEGTGGTNRFTVPITWTAGVPTLQADSTFGLTFVSASVQDYGDGLYRVHIAALNNTGGALTLDVKYYVQWDDTAAAVNTYAGGFQAETASTPSSYIPTAGATDGVTRAAETLTVPAANMPWPTPVEVSGAELVTGTWLTATAGGYDNTTSGTGASVTVTAGTTASRSYVNLTTVVGKVYSFSTTVDSVSSGDVVVYLRDAADGAGTILVQATISAGNTSVLTFVATTTTSSILALTSTAQDFVLSGVSVKEINPLSVSIQMDGRMTYADTALFREVSFVRWVANGTNYIENVMATNGFYEGRLHFSQRQSTSGLDSVYSSSTYFTPDVNVPFNIASRNGSTFLNGAEGGTALTANTAPTILPDLSATDLLLGNAFMGTIGQFRMWADDLGDTGIVEATAPSLEPSLSLTFDGSENSGFTVLDWSE